MMPRVPSSCEIPAVDIPAVGVPAVGVPAVEFQLWVLPAPLTGVSIWMLSAKLPMKAMMVIFCMSLSILLNCIMNLSSSDRFSRGFLSLS